ncbi:MAG: ECF transporter S component [Oscillospiraceae bacterium]|nr:ECF transporter S component [Oscillospiraceae bacterium]
MLVIRSERIRHILGTALPFAVMPALVLLLPVGVQAEYYALVSFLMVVLALLLFLSGFERKELGTRRMILVSVMTALSVIGRLLPLLKPITALTVLSALYLGKEAGFLVGAMSAVLSNFIMGQGPWTPFQMLAWGLIGLFAGIVSAPLRRSRILLYGYGLLSGAAYSMLLDVWTTVWTYKEFTLHEYAGVLVTALPYTVLYAVSNLLFLMIFTKPVGDKLTRIQKKYGL